MRVKSIILNFLSDAIPQLIIAIISLFRTKLFLFQLGVDITGLYQYFGQIMFYLSLVDGGLSSAVNFRLFKPITEKNYEKINCILSAANTIFLGVAVTILILGYGISYFIPSMIQNNPFSLGYIQVAFTIYLISNVLNYITVVHKSLFECDQKKYIVNMIYQPITIIRSLCEIGVLLWGGDLFTILFLQAVFGLLSNAIIVIMTKKSYPFLNLKKKQKDYDMVKDVSNLMIYKIGGLISYNIDIVLITKFLGLASSALYSAYLLIMDNLRTLVDKLTGATMGSIGNLISQDKEKGKIVFEEFNAFSFYLISLLCIPLLLVLNNFITIWYEGRYIATNYIALFFVLNLAYYILEIPLKVFINAAGLFKETRICPFLESIINLTLSLILIQVYGITGVLIATFISYMFGNYAIKPRILYKNLFNLSALSYYRKNICFIIGIIVNFSLMYMFYQLFSIVTFGDWVWTSCFLAIVNAIVVTIVFSLMKQLSFFRRISFINKYFGFLIK